ncbi:hypothetical protein F4779DRAFT_314335 [Xylariaceae sp. FL0662B]|nr:hypothetical protein F4779DRAFT_314335 [Xylariaceae sp. FL0662B]
MTEVVPADRTKLLQLKRAECNAIALSRKRKLGILYAVATSPDALPKRSFADPSNAQTFSDAESQFLDGCDILQGRKLNESNIPARPKTRSVEFPQQPVTNGAAVSNENIIPAVPAVPKKPDVDNIRRPTIPPPSTVSLPATGNDKQGVKNDTDAPTSSGTVLKQPQPVWPTHPVDPTARPNGAPTDKEQSQTSIPAKLEENVPKSAGPNATPQTQTSLPVSHLSLPRPNITQTAAVQRNHLHPERTDLQAPAHQGDEPIDIGVPTARKPDEIRATAQPAPQADHRLADTLSSPGSTAQTAATPVVHDTSTTTSPDHDGVPYAERVGDEAVDKKSEEVSNLKPSPEYPRPVFSGESANKPIVQSTTVSGDGQATEAVGSGIGKVSNGIGSQQSTKPSLPAVQAGMPESSGGEKTEHGTNVVSPTPTELPGGLVKVLPTTDPLKRHSEVSFGRGNEDTSSANENLAQSKGTEKEAAAISIDAVEVATPMDSEVSRVPSTPTISRQSERRRTSSPTSVARQKPVSEILGEPPKPSKDQQSQHTTPVTPTSQFSKDRPRSLPRKNKAKEKNKVSTVVFGKQPKRPSNLANSVIQNRPKTGQIPSDDYFTPLFVQAFTSSSKWMKPLEHILHQAHKTLSTPDSYTQILDNQACKVLRRVYHLQHHDKWSLRQPKRWPEPTRQPCHWDVLLQEMRWMRTDFREERKWKMAAARNLAYACAEWVSASAEDRKALQVNAAIPPRDASGLGDVSMGDADRSHDLENHPTPDLIPSAESDSPLEPDDEPHDNILDTVAPSAIFALEDDDIVFALHPSPNTDRLLEELPMYGSPLKAPKSDLIAPEYDPDASWRRPALPLSKFVEGRMELTPTEPPKKRSRYRYVQEEDEEEEEVVFDQTNSPQPLLEPQNPEVALFRPENKSIRDRLHAGHQFRPPNEHTMPFQSFYESRSPSQWIQSEDDELKSLVREYSYNWSLISSILSTKSMFACGAERRTPWECFERWVMLEGLPHDMQKTQYFKLWQNRIDTSQQLIRQQNQNIIQQQAQQQQQAGANGPITPLPRRRFSVPLKVERRRNQKHLTMIDAMRKLAKKRETAIQKQQHAASLAAMRKANETPQNTTPNKTPREYSIMRWERDQAIAERLAERMAQQQRHEAQRRVQAALQRAQQGQVAQMAAAQNASHLSQNTPQMAASHPHPGMARANPPNQIAVNGQGRPRIPMHTTPNGTGTPTHMAGGLVPPMQMNGASQVQMPGVNGQSRMAMPNPQPDLQLLMQAQQISEQQRRSVQMRQQQSHQNQQGNMHLQNSPPGMRAAALNGLNQKNYLNNAQAQAMMASFNTPNGSGMSTPPGTGLNMSSQAGSPRPNATIPQQTHQTYVSQLQQIESQIRQSHPNTPQDMVREMARQLLNNRHNNLAQSAMNAAAGGPGQTAVANGPHQYAQLLRAQQQQQAAVAAQAQQAQSQAQQGAQHQRNSSGSATPTPAIPK